MHETLRRIAVTLGVSTVLIMGVCSPASAVALTGPKAAAAACNTTAANKQAHYYGSPVQWASPGSFCMHSGSTWVLYSKWGRFAVYHGNTAVWASPANQTGPKLKFGLDGNISLWDKTMHKLLWYSHSGNGKGHGYALKVYAIGAGSGSLSGKISVNVDGFGPRWIRP